MWNKFNLALVLKIWFSIFSMCHLCCPNTTHTHIIILPVFQKSLCFCLIKLSACTEVATVIANVTTITTKPTTRKPNQKVQQATNTSIVIVVFGGWRYCLQWAEHKVSKTRARDSFTVSFGKLSLQLFCVTLAFCLLCCYCTFFYFFFSFSASPCKAAVCCLPPLRFQCLVHLKDFNFPFKFFSLTLTPLSFHRFVIRFSFQRGAGSFVLP